MSDDHPSCAVDAVASVFDLLPLGVWITDRAGTIVRSNEAAGSPTRE